MHTKGLVKAFLGNLVNIKSEKGDKQERIIQSKQAFKTQRQEAKKTNTHSHKVRKTTPH